MYSYCQEFKEVVLAPCGRQYSVCSVCDNGINECTEGYCTHLEIRDDDDECPGPNCDTGEEPCCDGCASGLGPCHGPGYHLVCYTHGKDC